MKKFSRSCYVSLLALTAIVLIVSCRAPGIQTVETPNPTSVSHSDKQTMNLVSEDPPFRFSMYPIYDSESESLVYFQIENLNDKTFVRDAEVVTYFIGLDGDSQKKIFKLAPDNKRYLTSLPLKHHENYDVQVFVQLPDKTKFSPRFSFHCADPLPELDWLSSEQGKKE